MPMTLQEWVKALGDELEVPGDVDIDLLLDVARDAAHSVSRPAAPLTTFLVGYAAAARGGGPDAVRAAAQQAAGLALASADPDPGKTLAPPSDGSS